GTPGTRNVGLAVASDGDILVTGIVSGTGSSIWGQGEPNETSITPSATDAPAAYVARYHENGDLVWLRPIEGGVAYATAVAGTPDGGALVSGYFSGSVRFDAGNFDSQERTSSGTSDAFLARYAANGGLLWVTSAGYAGVHVYANNLAALPCGGAVIG